MIREIDIKNYKSVNDIKIELGKINIFIGENGCGKTNILEGIALASAAADNKLDNEFLGSRGIRITDSKLMKSAFVSKNSEKEIILKITDFENRYLNYQINYNGGKNISLVRSSNSESRSLLKGEHPDYPNYNVDIFNYLADILRNPKVVSLVEASGKSIGEKKRKNKLNKPGSPVAVGEVNELVEIRNSIKKTIEYLENDIQPLDIQAGERLSKEFKISNFLIYTPENYFLRRFEEEGQIRPLGIRGEGLFKHLVDLFKEDKQFADQLTENLKLINWFEKLDIPLDLVFTESRINIKDRFIKETIDYFDQRSANEGFLYLLFYFILFMSEETPSFFAIDNIDTSLNPKLCAELINNLIKLSYKHNKQVILTTHNPAVLDGLNLADDEQRLFVIYRNGDGHTKAKRVKEPKKIDGVEPIRLSEAFIRGYLGGLPKNF